MRNSNLNGANLSGAILANTDLSNASLQETNLSNADLSSANLSNVDLSSANLSGANLSELDLSNKDLSQQDLSGAILRNSNLNGANLSDAILAHTDLSNASLQETNLSNVDLSSANLSEADLRRADLRTTNLRGTNLSGANLSNLDLSFKDLSEANLYGASVSGTNFSRTKLIDANLSETNLYGAINFSDAITQEAVGAEFFVPPPIPIRIPRLTEVVGANTRQDDPVGQFMLEYENIMAPDSSGQIRISIRPIPDFTEQHAGAMENIDEFFPGEALDDKTEEVYLFIKNLVSVELKAPDKFKIKRILPDGDSSSFQTMNPQEERWVSWLWSIDAPAITGNNQLFLEVDREGVNQSWLRSFKIFVGVPTPTPTSVSSPYTGSDVFSISSPTSTPTPSPTSTPIPSPTFTPTPTPTPTTLERIGKRFEEGSVQIFTLVFPMLMGGLVFIIQSHRTRRKEITDLRRELGKATTDRKVVEQEIKALQAIKWWQFWK